MVCRPKYVADNRIVVFTFLQRMFLTFWEKTSPFLEQNAAFMPHFGAKCLIRAVLARNALLYLQLKRFFATSLLGLDRIVLLVGAHCHAGTWADGIEK